MAIDLSSRGEGIEPLSEKYCAWCGKPNATSGWGGKNVRYCDFKCAAANGLGEFVVISIVLLFTLGLAIVSWPGFFWAIVEYLNIGRWQVGSVPFLVLEAVSMGLIGFYVFTTGFFCYATGIGYRMRKAEKSAF